MSRSAPEKAIRQEDYIMSCQRLSYSRVSAIPLLLLALSLWPAATQARTPATPWRTAWRPGWLPGDPERAADPNAPAPVWAPRHGHSSGLFIALDPITHLPTAPSEAEMRSFAEQAGHDALLAPTAPLRVERLPGGGEIIQLNGQFQSYSIARRDSRGRIVTDCVPDPATARKLLTQPAPPSRTVWEEK